jgi:hypothetical protein
MRVALTTLENADERERGMIQVDGGLGRLRLRAPVKVAESIAF